MCLNRIEQTAIMSNQLAIVLGLIIVSGLAVDAYSFDWTNTLYLARKLMDLIEWMAFWR
jgi:hypothetical protein